jgi:hypothetical protein
MEHEDIVVFLGPTLNSDTARSMLDANYQPPASRGDVYRASKSEPRLILLIDGFFESGAAVLHKEILWALSKGIQVCGAASMGALRAAELLPFGMMGFGKIFQAYRDAILERDDAVAVVHGPAELGYPPLNLSLVDVFATLEKSHEVGALTRVERDFLRDTASTIFYKQLDFETLIKAGVQRGFPRDRAENYKQHLSTNGVFSQKQADAIEVLSAIAGGDGVFEMSSATRFVFERTSAWEDFAAEQDEQQANPDSQLLSDTIETKLAAMGLLLAVKEAQRRGFNLDQADFAETVRNFRFQNNLNKFSEVQTWMEIARFTHEDYVNLMEDDFFVRHSQSFGRRLKHSISGVQRYKRSELALKKIRSTPEKQNSEK